MALITKSRYGLVAVNNEVLRVIVSKCVSQMGELVFPCNKKGKVYKSKSFDKDPRILNSIEISEDSEVITIDIYYVSKFGESLTDTAQKLFDLIEETIEPIKPEKAVNITAHIKGMMAKQVVPRDLEIVRKNG